MSKKTVHILHEKRGSCKLQGQWEDDFVQGNVDKSGNCNAGFAQTIVGRGEGGGGQETM